MCPPNTSQPSYIALYPGAQEEEEGALFAHVLNCHGIPW